MSYRVTFHMRSGASITVDAVYHKTTKSPEDQRFTGYEVHYPEGYTGVKLHQVALTAIEAVTTEGS